MLSEKLKGKYLDSIADDENLKKFIKRQEIFYYGIELCRAGNCDSNDDIYTFFVKIAWMIFILLLTVIITFFPYVTQIIPLIISFYCFRTKDIFAIIIILLIQSLGIMSFLGARGFYVNWGCLYHPSNWALFVVLIDLINLVLDIICPMIAYKICDSENLEIVKGLYAHILAIFYNLYRQISLYILFKKAYKEIREAETEIIKRCIQEWAKEKRYL